MDSCPPDCWKFKTFANGENNSSGMYGPEGQVPGVSKLVVDLKLDVAASEICQHISQLLSFKEYNIAQGTP
jgi:hypothetical protein